MKRYLFVMRHAKTEVQQENQKDFERQLTARGRENAKQIAQNMQSQCTQLPECIIASAAVRTQQTAEIVAKTWQMPSANIYTDKSLYLCGPDTIEHSVMALEDHIKSAIIIAHNPGISEFAWDLGLKVFLSHMPTGACLSVSFESDSWKNWAIANKQLAYYDYPKKNI